METNITNTNMEIANTNTATFPLSDLDQPVTDRVLSCLVCLGYKNTDHETAQAASTLIWDSLANDSGEENAKTIYEDDEDFIAGHSLGEYKHSAMMRLRWKGEQK